MTKSALSDRLIAIVKFIGMFLMKFLLTSTGFSNSRIKDKFCELMGKPINQVKVAFIPTASRTAGELKYVNISKYALIDLGVKKSNIFVFDLKRKIDLDVFSDIDVIYVCGGNTFYLMKMIRESGFDIVMNALSKKNTLYVGVSAGSIIVGPNIEIAIPFDENDIQLMDFTGLKLVDIVVSPHYVTEDEPLIKPFVEKFNVVRITDDEAVLVDKTVTVIY